MKSVHFAAKAASFMMLYATGNKDGVMWEVEDELGNKGWVSSLVFGLSR